MAVDAVGQLAAIGLIPSDPPYPEQLVSRVRFVGQLERSGIAPMDLAEALRDGALDVESIDWALERPSRVEMLDATLSDLAGDLAVSDQFVAEVQTALGTVEGAEVSARADDAEILTSVSELVGLGIPEPIALRTLQNMSDNLRRVARGASEMWEDGIRGPLAKGGTSYADILGVQNRNGGRLQQLGDRLVHLLWNRFLDDAIFSGTMATLERALVEAGVTWTRSVAPPAIAFMDLTAFTYRTGEHGDAAAAVDVSSLGAVVRRTVVRNGGSIVKMLGDGAMLHFPEAGSAIRCGLSIVDDVALAGLPPARVGINAGQLIARDVDYFGQTVNIAARLVDYARPGEVLVTSVAAEAAQDSGCTFAEIGSVSLKGVEGLVDVLSATRSDL